MRISDIIRRVENVSLAAAKVIAADIKSAVKAIKANHEPKK